MLKRSKTTRLLSLILAVAGFVLVGGHFSQAYAQCASRDPFCTPNWKIPRKPATTTTSDGKTVKEKPKGPPPPMPVVAPAIDLRISYYKQQRELAAQNGQPIPKVTSVLTIDELAVSGIFKTSRGFAAMVEATPIKLSYTIYPGEKFFDGQLVAIEENRLIFRRVVKMTNNKFIASVENKSLRQYSVQQEVQGTVPTENNSANKTEVANTNQNPSVNPEQNGGNVKPNSPTMIISPVDEMNKQPESKPENSVKEKNGKKDKKTVKVAKKS